MRSEFEEAAFATMADGNGADHDYTEDQIQKVTAKHKYYVDIAPHAWKAYEYWRSNPKWQGKYLQQRRRQLSGVSASTL